VPREHGSRGLQHSQAIREPSKRPARSDAKRETPAATTRPPSRKHALRLTEGTEALRSLRQVVQRPQEEHRVHGAIRLLETAGVADPRFDRLARASCGVQCVLDVKGDRIDQDDAVATACEPHRVDP
jgi:hypothetical protein